MRVDILWNQPTGYLAACLNELARVADVSLSFPVERDGANDAAAGLFSDAIDLRPWVAESGRTFKPRPGTPDRLLISGWTHRPYLRYAAKLAGQTRRILTMDNQWHGTVRQRAASGMQRFTMRPYFDCAFVPGARQAVFARRLGFNPADISLGSYSCDVALFSQTSSEARGRRLVVVARLVPEKGIDLLLAAYHRHRVSSPDPLVLTIVGEGPLRGMCEAQEGVELLGFLQPAEVRVILNSSLGLALTSRSEPWGVVLHEGAASGLPLLASDACGAADVFIDPSSGWVHKMGDVDGIEWSMNSLADMGSKQWNEMSLRSKSLAGAITPRTWVDAVTSV
jgi:glycosyltransferase involved in cell wall biosynthesis